METADSSLSTVSDLQTREGKVALTVSGGNILVRGIPMHVVRIVLWPAVMSYSGFILTGQGLRTLNELSVTESFLGVFMGFLLAVMFRLREKRRQKPAFVSHSIAQIFPEWNVLNPPKAGTTVD